MKRHYFQVFLTAFLLFFMIGCDKMHPLSDERALELYDKYQEILLNDAVWNEEIEVRYELLSEEEAQKRQLVHITQSEKDEEIKQWRDVFLYLSQKEQPIVQAYNANGRVDICYMRYSERAYLEASDLIGGKYEIQNYAAEFYDEKHEEIFSIRLICNGMNGRYEIKIYWNR